MKNLYEPSVVAELHSRIGRLRPESQQQWGRMSVPQMLAHCAMTMEMALGESPPLPRHPLGRLIGWLAKRSLLVKGKPLGRNAPTHPTVVVGDQRNFQYERRRLEDSIDRFANGGPQACTRHPHFFFGAMTPAEWSAFSYIHLDHHLRQFGV